MIFFAGAAQAASNTPRVQFYEMKGGSAEPLQMSSAAKWEWSVNSDSANVLKMLVVAELPKQLIGLKVRSLSQTAKLVIKDNKIKILTGAQNTRLQFAQGSEVHDIEMRIANESSNIQEQHCKELRLQLKAPDADAPFFIGASCIQNADKIAFHLTIPEEANVDQSSMFESKGKGESWRIYDLGKINATSSGEVGRITLRFKNKPYLFIFVSTKKNEKDDELSERRFTVGLGYDSLALTGSASGKDNKFLLMLGVIPFNTWHSFGAGINLDVTFNVSSSATAINYIQADPFLFYHLIKGRSFIFDPRLHFVITNETQTTTGVGFQTNQVGAGALATVIFGSWRTNLEFMTESFASQVIKSHSLINLSISQNPVPQKVRYGCGVEMQTHKVQDPTGPTYQFSQTTGYFQVLF